MRLNRAWLALPVAAITFPAFAQIAPPPGPAATPTPEWSPPVPSAKLPVNPAIKQNVERIGNLPKLPDLPYDSLVKRDASGKVVRLTEPAQHAALRNNPSIDAETRQRLVAVLAHRQSKIDRLAIENLDLIDKIEAGAIDRLQGADSRAFLKSMFDLTKPLRPADGELNSDLRNSQQISFEQSRWSQELWQEYNRAVGEEIRKNASSSGSTDTRPYQKFTEVQRIEETLMAHPRMLVEASRSLDKTLPQLGLSAETKAKIEPTVKQISSASDDAKREQLMRDLGKNLTIQERQELLRKTIALRPPLPAIQSPPVRAVAPPAETDSHEGHDHPAPAPATPPPAGKK